MLSTEDLLAGSALTYEVDVPAPVLDPDAGESRGGETTVRLRPLTVRDLQLISRAARDSDALVGTLMVQRALVEPAMSVADVSAAHVGLVQFLLGEVNRISGITASSDELAAAARAPLARAAYVLESEFGWTPEQVSELTVGQLALHLQMLSERPAA